MLFRRFDIKNVKRSKCYKKTPKKPSKQVLNLLPVHHLNLDEKMKSMITSNQEK